MRVFCLHQFYKKNCFKSAFSTLVFHIFRNFLFFYIIYWLYKWTRGGFNISMLFSSHHGRLLIIWNDIECHCELRFTKRGMVKCGFLDNRDNYSGTWSLILMKFCMMGSFLVYFQEMLSFWPSDLHGGCSGIPPFQLKKSLWNISVHKNYPLCEVRTSKNAMASE